MKKTYTITAPAAHDGVERETRSKPMKELYVIMAICLGSALFFVNFIWGFFDREINALGINMTVLLSLGYLLFYKVYAGKRLLTRSNLPWLIPFGLIALSFSLYDNPFLKAFSILVLPTAFIVFYNYAQLKHRERRQWDLAFFNGLFIRAFGFLPKVSKAASLYSGIIFPGERKGLEAVKKVLIGILLFAAMALIVVIPLLSSADPLFADKMNKVYQSFGNIISLSFISKTIVVCGMSIFLLAASLAWLWPFELTKHSQSDKEVDSIITGIVLGGILLLYLLFLYLQLNRLWVNALPINFQETEDLVKSGFWQLFVLSVINILLFSLSFRKTNALVHKVLAVFVGASCLLLLSAGYRMYLYVTLYGFSYEKFFATYTVVFIGVLFVWIVSRFFQADKPNTMKFSAFLFIWMFTLATVFPIEQFILQSNIALALRPDSRIKLYELTMLSPDILSSVEKYVARDADKCEYGKVQSTPGSLDFCGWNDWLKERRENVNEKKWYEANLMNLIYWKGF